MVVLHFVVDLIDIGHDVVKIDAMISDLGTEFLPTVEEDITSFSGIQIKMLPNNALLLTQTSLTDWILKTCSMTHNNAKDTPASSIVLDSDISGLHF